MIRYGVTSDYEYNATHRRERLSIWSGPFYSVWEGEAYSLASGYMLTTYNGDKIRVVCPTPRRDDNHEEIDAAIGDALRKHYGEGM